MIDLESRIRSISEYQAIRLAPNVIVWKEGAEYNFSKTNQQFDQLEALLEEQEGELYYFIDLSKSSRPSPEMVQLIEKRLKPLVHRFKHSAVYTGKNTIMFLGIKFYFIRFDFPSYSAHTSIQSALQSFV